MDDEPEGTPEPAARQKPSILFRIRQWILFAFLILMAVTSLPLLRHLSLPGVPVLYFWASLGVLLCVAIAHLPSAFFLMPQKGRNAAYFALLPALAMFTSASGMIFQAYEATPAGAREKDAREDDERNEAERDAKLAAAAAKVEKAADEEQGILEIRKKVANCLSWSGRFGPLEDEVKGALHNPHAFEHVKTEVIGPTPDGDNLEITFRAENGFGALREGWARAKVNSENCELESVGRLNVND